MASTFRFLATDDEAPFVVSWFADLPERPNLTSTGSAVAVRFQNEQTSPSGRVNIFLPMTVRGVIRTAGEVHFLDSWSASPALAGVLRRFRKFLAQFERVHPVESSPWNHFLEGSLRNFDAPIVALPAAFAALNEGTQYFVSDDESQSRIDTLCLALRLRGIDCAPN